MDLPVFEELKIKNFDVDQLLPYFEQQKVGRRPCFIKMPKDDPEKLRGHLINILLVLKKMKVDPRFPYPLYLISEVRLNSKIIPQIRSEREIPGFFFCKNQKITSRESSLINKISIIRERMRNFNYEGLMEDMNEYSNHHKKVYQLAREHNFLTTILEHWKNQEIEKEMEEAIKNE